MIKLTKTKLLASLILAILFSITCSNGPANNPPPENKNPVIENQTFTASENIDVGVAIGTVVASDPESKALTYSITSNNSNFFNINATSGLLSLADEKSLDYEMETSHIITIEASNGELSSSATVTLMVEDVTIGDRYCGAGSRTNPPMIDGTANDFFASGTGIMSDPYVVPIKTGCRDFTFIYAPSYTTTAPPIYFTFNTVPGTYTILVILEEALKTGEPTIWRATSSEGHFMLKGFTATDPAMATTAGDSALTDLIYTNKITLDILGFNTAGAGGGWFGKKGFRIQRQ